MIEHPELKAEYDKLSIIEKYAFLNTLVHFMSGIDNLVESNDVRDQTAVYIISQLIHEILEFLSLSEDDIDKAAEFDERSIITPIDILQTIKNKMLLNSLLDTCSAMVESSKGDIYGHDIHEMAVEELFSYFNALGFSTENIEESINRIHNSGLF